MLATEQDGFDEEVKRFFFEVHYRQFTGTAKLQWPGGSGADTSEAPEARQIAVAETVLVLLSAIVS